jgi:integrase
MKSRGTGEIYRRGNVWWVSYHVNGKRHRESSKSDVRKDAVRLLRLRTGWVAQGHEVAPDTSKTTFADLKEMLLNDYRTNGRKSLDRMEIACNNLSERFEHWRACNITTDEITKYIAERQRQGRKNGTINREMAALGRAFRLALRARKVAEMPHGPMLSEKDNVHRGFLSEGDLNNLLEHLPTYLHALVICFFFTGWRRGELLSRERRHYSDGWLVLESGEGKTKTARQFPVSKIPRLQAALDEQLERVAALERATGQIVPWLFPNEVGGQISDFRGSWESACRKAGVPNALVHDFRRTAARAMTRAGIPTKTAMELLGHKTMSIFFRYNIIDEGDLIDGGEKLAAYFAKSQPTEQKVIPLKTGTEN